MCGNDFTLRPIFDNHQTFFLVSLSQSVTFQISWRKKNFGKKGHLKKTLIYFPVVVLPGTSFEFPCKYLLKVVIKVLFLMSA